MAFRRFVCVAALLTAALGCGGPSADMSAEGSAPLFEVDPLWPKPLPNHWLLGSTIGVAVDSRDHVWIIHRGNFVDNEIPAALGIPEDEFDVVCAIAVGRKASAEDLPEDIREREAPNQRKPLSEVARKWSAPG